MTDSSDLDETPYDAEIALLRGLAGAVPGFGPMLSEIIGLRVPGQRFDRAMAFLKDVDVRLSDVEQKQLSNNAYFVDMLQDAIEQSTRSLSEQRNNFLATFMEVNKDIQERDHSVKKKLLQTLEKLTDTDIEILQTLNNSGYGYHKPQGMANKRRTNHGYNKTKRDYSVESMTTADFQAMSEQQQYEFRLAQVSWEAHMVALEQLKLIIPIHVIPPDGDRRILHVDQRTGLPNIESYEITRMGEILLKSIGIQKEDKQQ